MFKLVGGITLQYRTLLHEFKEVSWAQSAELLTFAALLIPTIPYTCKKIKFYGTVKCTGKAVGFVHHSCMYIFIMYKLYGTVDLQHVRPSALCVGHNQLSF